MAGVRSRQRVGRHAQRLMVALAVLIVPGCTPIVAHIDCPANGPCGATAPPTSVQDLTVSGADQAHFTDGKGRCQQIRGSAGSNEVVRRPELFVVDLWIPASRPRYLIQMRIEGYRGPGTVSSEENLRVRYDPVLGAVVHADVYPVPSGDRVGVVRSVEASVGTDEASGAMRLELPDRTIDGRWRCVRVSVPGQP